MRNKFAEIFYELGCQDEKLCLVVADISPAGSIEKFRKEFPDRFINTGVAEQIMIGITAGMAQRGLRPFAYTIATFALYRPFEFIRDDLCYQNLPVTVVGIGGGRSYSTLGATHHAQEDIAVASTLPNMSIIAPCDPLEVEAATRWCAKESHGPTYMRLGKAGEPNLTSNALEPWSFGKIRQIKSGENIAIISYGAISAIAIEVWSLLKEKGSNSSVYFASTLKPFDYETMNLIMNSNTSVVIIEEHISFGGLAMQIKSHYSGVKTLAKIIEFSFDNDFAHVYGSHQELLSFFGLDPVLIVERLIKPQI